MATHISLKRPPGSERIRRELWRCNFFPHGVRLVLIAGSGLGRRVMPRSGVLDQYVGVGNPDVFHPGIGSGVSIEQGAAGRPTHSANSGPHHRICLHTREKMESFAFMGKWEHTADDDDGSLIYVGDLRPQYGR